MEQEQHRAHSRHQAGDKAKYAPLFGRVKFSSCVIVIFLCIFG